MNGNIQLTLASVLLGAGKYQEAKAACEANLANHPGRGIDITTIALAEALSGNLEQAVKKVTEAALYDNITPIALLTIDAIIRAEAGESGVLENAISKSLEARLEGYQSAVQLGSLYFKAGDEDTAFEWFERGLEERDPNLLLIGTFVAPLTGVTEHPRMIDILTRAGIYQEWQANGKVALMPGASQQ